MTGNAASTRPFLICHSGTRGCAFPLEHVVEVMRALPLESFPAIPSFICGLSMIRGALVPVVNLAMLLGDANCDDVTRYVTVKTAHRVAAFAVGSVVGVAQLESSAIDDLPSLVADADTDQGIVAAIGKVDADLFLILELARAIPESDWLEWDLPEVTS